MDKFKILEIIEEVKPNTLIAASKYVDEQAMIELYNLGIKDFGENRVEAFINKHFLLRNYDITWHFIGHLQRNKAKLIINDIDYLHSLESIELMKVINNLRDKPLKCFIEIKLSDSLTKYGINESELESFLEEAKKYPKVEIVGLMTMTEIEMTCQEKLELFKKLVALGNKYKLHNFSMGMSSDYKEALEAGATHVRLGI